MALTLRNALRGGRRGGIFTALGIVSGLLTWTLATSLGLSAILLASEPAFMALKFAGAIYLAALGLRALRDGLFSTGQDDMSTEESDRPIGAGTNYRQGLLSNLGNPKIAVFFTSLLPQFTSDNQASFLALLLLGLMFCAMTLLWLALYATLVARAGNVLRRPAIRRTLDSLTGFVLIGLGIRLATEHR